MRGSKLHRCVRMMILAMFFDDFDTDPRASTEKTFLEE